MSGLRDDFYNQIGMDYHDNMERSFIYGYIKGERENSLRLRLKEELFCLCDTPLSKGKLSKLLVHALITDKNLSKQTDNIKSLPLFIEEAEKTLGRKLTLNAVYDELKSGFKLDVDIKALISLANEVLASFEFEGEKKNPYVQLTSLHRDLEYGCITKGDYIRGFITFVLDNSKYMFSREDMKHFQQLGTYAFGEDVFNGLRRAADKLERLLALSKSSCDTFDRCVCDIFSSSLIDDITGRVQEEIINVEIKTLLYDAGFSVETGVYRAPRKKEHSLELMDAYIAYQGTSIFDGHLGGSAIPGGFISWEAYYEECDRLKSEINSQKNNTKYFDVFIPLWIDNEYGGGVYLIGKNILRDGVEVEIKNNCEIGVVCFSGIFEANAYEIDSFNRDSSCSVYPGMEEAVRWYKSDVRGDSLSQFKAFNTVAPKDCPEYFTKFFNSSDRSHPNIEEYDTDPFELEEMKRAFDIEFEEEQHRAVMKSRMKKR